MIRVSIPVVLCLSVITCGLVGCVGDALKTTMPAAAPTETRGHPPPPTATPRPTVAPIGPGSAVAAPSRPDRFERYGPTIVTYLNDTGGDQDALRAMLRDWGALRHATDLLRIDVDDDGAGELLMVIVDPSPEYGINPAGDVLVVGLQKKRFEVLYSAAGGSVLLDPALIEVDDLNGDGHTEIAYSSTSCGAHTCFTTVYIVSSGTGTYRDLTAGGIEMSYVEPYFADWDDDGVLELIMHGGIIASVGAGPQRQRTEVYEWDGATYVLLETLPDYSQYLYFRVLDANQALLDGEYERAAALYREAVDNPRLQTWMEPSERDDLAAFSRYRLCLTYLMMDEVTMAEAANEELQSAQPEHIYARVVAVLWSTYSSDRDLRAACQAVADFARLFPETAAVLDEYGYSNPAFTAEEVCPLELF